MDIALFSKQTDKQTDKKTGKFVIKQKYGLKVIAVF